MTTATFKQVRSRVSWRLKNTRSSSYATSVVAVFINAMKQEEAVNCRYRTADMSMKHNR